ncbi:hypothetical protein DKX38_022193 [Salix brachista]|uniref:F-box domain-containing protein n=1 Tax=Salix brachista TaxID=2182728 RepID=A0A5N5K287_9ROSI|nr:hypothetical protein DKX38_022184 [Salix brachista]KAB5524444.1 hypothetical protein DKX38_022193 [Salix brachista]
MSSASKALLVAAAIGGVEALKDQGFCRWNYTLRSLHQHAKNHVRSVSQAKKLSSSSSAMISNIFNEEKAKQAEESLRKVMYLSCVCDEKRRWSDLPGDVVALIFSRLCAPDCYRFVAVCKSWSSFPLPKIKKEFPTLVYLKSDGKLINFLSPLLCCSTPEIASSMYKNIITSDSTNLSSDIEDNELDWLHKEAS